MRTRLREWHVFVPALALAIPLVVLQGRPSLRGDTSVFLSVGARILEGDRLYVDVYDNKDPLFLYAYAGAMWAGGWRAPFLLDIIWLTIAGSSVALLLRRLTVSWQIAICALLAYPLLLTAYWYATGHSQLAALSLTPLAALLWVRGLAFAAGLIVGIALLFKLVLALVIVAPIVILAALRHSSYGHRGHGLVRLVGGLALVLGAAALLLGLRGELTAYLRVLSENFDYSGDVLTERGDRGGIVGHVLVVRGSLLRPAVFLALNVAAALIAGLLLTHWRQRATWATPASRCLALMYLVVAGATAVTLALTAAWPHHIQMLAFPSMLMTCLLFSLVLSTRASPVRLAAAAGAAAAVLVVLGVFMIEPNSKRIPVETWWSPPEHPSFVADAMNDVRTKELAGRARIPYIVLGGNDERGHAAFMNEAYELECPRFHQYQFSSYLDEVVSCLVDRRPTVVVTTRKFRVKPGMSDDWRRFIGEASAVLDDDYVRVRRQSDVAIWIRRR